MRSAASKRVLWLTETAALTALLIILQTVTKPAGQYVTGSCVNAVLAVSALAVGVGSALTVALLSPFFAFLLGIGPQLLPIVPSIAVGNLVFVALLGLLAGGRDLPLWRSAGAVLAAAVCKFGALYLLVVKLLCTVLPLKGTPDRRVYCDVLLSPAGDGPGWRRCWSPAGPRAAPGPEAVAPRTMQSSPPERTAAWVGSSMLFSDKQKLLIV